MSRRALARTLAIATVLVVAACGGTTSGGGAKTTAAVAIVPGGPHPYFEPMRQAIVDAKADFSLSKGTFEVPTDWKQDLQNQLLTSLAAKGYDGFGIFPTDGNAANGIVSQLAAKNYPVIAVGGCVQEPTKTTFCIATDVANSAYTGAKAAIQDAIGCERRDEEIRTTCAVGPADDDDAAGSWIHRDGVDGAD